MTGLELNSLRRLLIVQMLFWLREGVISPIFALFVRHAGATLTDIGILMMVRSLGWAIFEPIFGIVAHRLGKKRLLIFSLVTTSITYVSYVLASSIWHFYLISFVISSLMAAGTVSSRAMTVELLPESGRGKAYGRFMAVMSIGRMAGPPMGGFLADSFGFAAPFYISGGLGLVSVFMTLPLSYKEILTEEVPTLEKKTNRKRFLTKPLIGLLIIRALYMFNMNFQRNVLPVFLNESEVFKASETEIGFYMGIMQFTSGLSQIFIGSLTDRAGSKKLMISGLGLGGLSYLTLILLQENVTLYLLGALQGIFFASVEISMMINLMENISKGSSGIAMGAYGFSEDVGGMISSFTLGVVYDEVGSIFSILSVSMVMLSGALLSLLVVNYPPRARVLKNWF